MPHGHAMMTATGYPTWQIRATPRRIIDVMQTKRLDGFPMTALLPWAGVRTAIEQAERRGRPVDYPIAVRDTPDY